jgi:hypothetical protein
MWFKVGRGPSRHLLPNHILIVPPVIESIHLSGHIPMSQTKQKQAEVRILFIVAVLRNTVSPRMVPGVPSFLTLRKGIGCTDGLPPCCSRVACCHHLLIAEIDVEREGRISAGDEEHAL